MALHAGLATSKILLIVGASIAGSILVKNGSVTDFLDDAYKVFAKHLKSEGGDVPRQSSVDPKILAQINSLRQQLSDLAFERSSITVVTGSKSRGSIVSVTVPALLLGAAGYGYLRWKGFSISDFMYVTRRSMSNAVTSVSKQLEQVSTALSTTKRHLSSRLEHLSSNLDQNVELQAEIKSEVLEVRGDVARYGLEIETVQRLVQTLGVKIETIENKQDIANCGVIYLCNFVEKMHTNQPRETLQGVNRPRLESKPWLESRPRLERGSGSSSGVGLKDLESISNALESMDLRTEISSASDAGTSSDRGPSPRLQRNLTANFATGITRAHFFGKS